MPCTKLIEKLWLRNLSHPVTKHKIHCGMAVFLGSTLLQENLKHLYDSRTQHEKCRRIFKHVLKPYGTRSHNQNVRMTSCTQSFPDATSARYKSRIRQS